MNTTFFMGALVLLLLMGCDQTATQSMLDGSRLDVLDEDADASGAEDGADATADRRAVQDRPDADASVPPLPAVYATENVPLRRIFASHGHTFATALDGSFRAGRMQPAEHAPRNPLDRATARALRAVLSLPDPPPAQPSDDASA